MKGRWESKTIGEIASVKGGRRVPKGYKLLTEPTLYPYITVSDFSEDGTVAETNLKYIDKTVYEQIKQYTISSDDLYISIAGTIGKTGSVPKELSGSNLTENACKLIFHDGLDKKFVYYFTKSNSFIEQTGINTRVAAQPKLALKRLKTISLPLPPLREQKRIVDILNVVFSSITKAVANAEKNLANACELFESYLNSIFTQNGGEWVEKSLGDAHLLQIIDGDRGKNYPKKAEFFDDGYCLFLNTKNVRPDGFNFDLTMFITEEKDKVLHKGKLQRRDVILTTRGTIGNIAIYENSVKYDHIRINSGMLIFRPNESVITSEYLFEVMRSSIIKMQIAEFTTGAAQPQLPIKTLVNFTIPVPKSIRVQGQIVSRLHKLSQQTQHLETIYKQKLTALAELKQSILQKAFTGELTAEVVNQQVMNE